jgi:hypothetical protein
MGRVNSAEAVFMKVGYNSRLLHVLHVIFGFVGCGRGQS